MKKILFIMPPNITYGEFVKPPQNVKQIKNEKGQAFGSVITDIPLGPLSLSAYLKKHLPVETRLVDFNVELNRVTEFDYASFRDYFREFLSQSEIAEYAPTIIGISTLFATSYRSFIDLAELCRELFPDALMLGGGNLPTAVYKEIMRDIPLSGPSQKTDLAAWHQADEE